ncbi:MAG: hypothetical protein K6E47_14610 [Lachnospiraceae bacterium]|nr:hypothetical protein [Lachnospiraceae bacterium]
MLDNNLWWRYLSRPRVYLIDHGIIAAPERGKVMFCIPYLADFLKKDEQVAGAVKICIFIAFMKDYIESIMRIWDYKNNREGKILVKRRGDLL